jgi:hypothetical protein
MSVSGSIVERRQLLLGVGDVELDLIGLEEEGHDLSISLDGSVVESSVSSLGLEIEVCSTLVDQQSHYFDKAIPCSVVDGRPVVLPS